MSIITLEIVLRKTTILDQIDSPEPSYIPDYLKEGDAKIDASGFLDSHGFRTNTLIPDLVEHLKANRNCKIVVLGDSNVWGDGVYPNANWPYKLQKLVKCDVYPFGLRGWSSIEYFGFYNDNLRDVDFDFLIVGIVRNDPHPRGRFLSYNFPPDFMPYDSPDKFSLAKIFTHSTTRSFERVNCFPVMLIQ
jgi:hypothetical protein